MYKKFKGLSDNIKYFTFYIIIVVLIGYFMYSIAGATSELGKKEALEMGFNKEYDLNIYQKYNDSINLNLLTSGVIRSVAFDLIQIIFLVFLMSCLYIHQTIREYGTK
jgi:flagellar basal body-associated protein FliL